jgi:hypothetical protein
MFSIPWFITLFATKIESCELVLEFWSVLSDKDTDETIIFFISIALILKNRDKIVSQNEAYLPEIMTSLSIKSSAEMYEIISLAN